MFNQTNNSASPRRRGRPRKTTIQPVQTDKSNETVGTSTDLIEIIDNNVNNLSVPSTHFSRESITLPDFNGDSSDVSIENWLARFEEIMKFRSWNEHESIFMLGNYLKGEALE